VPDLDPKAEAISRVPLFSSCSEEDLVAIAAIATEAEFGAGEVLCRQGDEGGEFFVIREGRVDVNRDGASIDMLRAGDFFGELALITKAPRNATVQAIDPLQVFVIQSEDFHDLLNRTPSVFYKVFIRLAERVPAEKEI
jgi:CRP-like cAMP-binding protein